MAARTYSHAEYVLEPCTHVLSQWHTHLKWLNYGSLVVLALDSKGSFVPFVCGQGMENATTFYSIISFYLVWPLFCMKKIKKIQKKKGYAIPQKSLFQGRWEKKIPRKINYNTINFNFWKSKLRKVNAANIGEQIFTLIGVGNPDDGINFFFCYFFFFWVGNMMFI